MQQNPNIQNPPTGANNPQGSSPSPIPNKPKWLLWIGIGLAILFVISFLGPIASFLGAIALLCLIIGLISPNVFSFLLKQKTSRKQVLLVFGVPTLVLAAISGSTSPPAKAPVASESASNPSSKAVGVQDVKQSQARQAEADKKVRLAQERAKAAEKRAAAAEARANQAETVANEPVAKQEEPVEKQITAGNVEVANVEGLGKRELGKVNDVIYFIESVEETPAIESQFNSSKADGKYVVVTLQAANQDKETHNATTMTMKLIDSQEREYQLSQEGTGALLLAGDKTAEMISTPLQPGTPKRFTLVFDTATDAKGFKIKIPAATFSLDPEAIISAP